MDHLSNPPMTGADPGKMEAAVATDADLDEITDEQAPEDDESTGQPAKP